METETIRVHRIRRRPIATWSSWRVGPLPSRDTFDEIQIKWALLEDEPGDSTGNPPSPGDQLIGLIESHDATFSIAPGGSEERKFWGTMATWGREAEDSPMVGAAAHGSGDTVVEAIQSMLQEAGVG